MAVDMFLELPAPIKGETVDKTYKSKNAIDVLAWSWGMSNSGTFHQGSGGGSGKANVQDISVTKYVDKASAELMNACLTGAHLANATLTVRKAGGTPLEYIQITMTEVLITSVTTGGSGGEDRLTENISLNFAKVKFVYKMQNEKGGQEVGGQVSYDIAANTKE